MNMFTGDSNFIYILKMMGQKVIINGKEEQVLISNYKDKVIDYKKIKAIVPFNTGDIIEYQGINWVVIGEVSKNNTIYKATMRKAQHILKFYVKGEKIFETPTIVEISSQSSQEGKIISLVDGKIELFIRDITPHRKITYNNRFIMMNILWKVVGYTREIEGLIHLYCDKSTFIAEDNKTLEIGFNTTYNTNI